MTDKIYPVFLVDDYPDGAINEKAWVQVTPITDTPPKAIEWMAQNASDCYDEEDMRLVVIGQSHQKPSGYPVPGKEGDVRVVEELDKQPPCKECKGTGKYVIDEGTDDEVIDECDECYGTGKSATFIFDSCEPIPWEASEPDHPEALHFWNMELTDDPDAPQQQGVSVNEDQERMDV